MGNRREQPRHDFLRTIPVDRNRNTAHPRATPFDRALEHAESQNHPAPDQTRLDAELKEANITGPFRAD
jgi:hypothetical protein